MGVLISIYIFVLVGMLLESERKIIEKLQTPYHKYYVPMVWASSLVTRARKDGKLKDYFSMNTIIGVSEIKFS